MLEASFMGMVIEALSMVPALRIRPAGVGSRLAGPDGAAGRRAFGPPIVFRIGGLRVYPVQSLAIPQRQFPPSNWFAPRASSSSRSAAPFTLPVDSHELLSRVRSQLRDKSVACCSASRPLVFRMRCAPLGSFLVFLMRCAPLGSFDDRHSCSGSSLFITYSSTNHRIRSGISE